MLKCRNLTVIFCINLISYSAFAGVYSFGGGCGTQGAWTHDALSQTHLLIQAAETLKNNEKCKGIESIVPKIKIAQEALNGPADEANRMERAQELPNEIRALREASIADPRLAGQATPLLAAKATEAASMEAEAKASISGTLLSMVSDKMPFTTRVSRASSTGLAMLEQVMMTLPSYDECLIGAPDQAAAIFGATVKMAAAYASSGEGITSQIGNSISNLVTMLRNRKFTRVLRKLNESEFWMSMSCLMETTAQTYCSAQDGYELLRFGIDQLKPTNKNGKIQLDNPLEGYYLLVQNVPVISEWLQAIQIGIEPKLRTDAERKNNVWDTVTACFKDSNEILGRYSEDLQTLRTIKDIKSKKNAVLEMVKKIKGMMMGDPMAASVNFFTMSVFGDMIPFYLIGMDTIPKECASNSEGRFLIPWETWMQNGGNFQPMFDDPDELAKTVGLRTRNIIFMAQDKASSYFRQWMIVDMPNLVNQALTSQRFSVVESLQLIDRYLTGLSKRVVRLNGDYAILPSIRDTQTRIRKTLQTFAEVRDLEKVLAAAPEITDAMSAQVQAAYQNVIGTAFDQFNVWLQRDSFMINRMSTFVNYDYALRIRSREDMTPYQHDLLIATGKGLLDKILEVHSINPASVQNDLNSAQVVNKRNLEALESLLRDSLVPVLDELKMIAEGKRPSDMMLDVHTVGRLMQDSYNGRAAAEHPLLIGTMQAFGFVPGVGPGIYQSIPLVYKFLHPDRYTTRTTSETTFRGVDDPRYRFFDQFKAKLCIHTLAFEDRGLFQPFCQGSVLNSVFPKASGDVLKLDVAYDDYVKPNQLLKATTADNICAFRDYGRRNLVYWLLHDLNNAAPAASGQ